MTISPIGSRVQESAEENAQCARARAQSVAVGDVDGDGHTEIFTGGDYHDGTRSRAQLCVWDGAKLSLARVVTRSYGDVTWYWSVTIGDVDGDVEIVTGGSWHFWTPGWGLYEPPWHYWAQLAVWDGATLELENYVTWYWKEDTDIYLVAVGDVDGEKKMEIVTGGFYAVRYTLSWAQLCVWGFT